MTGFPCGDFRQLFPRRYIPSILLLIFKVGKNIRKQTEVEREDSLTTRLHRRLIQEPLFRDGPLQVNLQPDIVKSDSDPEKDTPEGRLDLQVCCGLGYEVYFAIEAKRLRVSLPSGLFKGSYEYVYDGMMRYISGKYAPFMQAGAMLGYVYDGDTQTARKDIDRQIQKKEKELRLVEPKKLAQSSIFSLYPIDETRHDLENRLFTIYHLFLGLN